MGKEEENIYIDDKGLRRMKKPSGLTKRKLTELPKEGNLDPNLYQLKMEALGLECLGKAKQLKALADKYKEEKARSDFYLEVRDLLIFVSCEASILTTEYRSLDCFRLLERRDMHRMLIRMHDIQQKINEVEEENLKLKAEIDKGMHRNLS